MARYLDPKHDLIFKRIFGENKDLLLSFLNALMPFDSGRYIQYLEYLPTEQVPENPAKKNSIVDVKCIDNFGRQFIVEMQMFWSELFNYRLVFNATKAYSRQLGKGDDYKLLQPVYGLGIINDIFDRVTDKFYHHYQTINKENTDEVIKGLEFVLIELPKFKPESWADRRMAVLWLRFLKEVESFTEHVSSDLTDNNEINKALTICAEATFTSAELEAYDNYWDYIRTERGLVSFAKSEGLAEGRQEGLAEGRQEGLAEGRQERDREIVLNATKSGATVEQIQAFTGISRELIIEILKS